MVDSRPPTAENEYNETSLMPDSQGMAQHSEHMWNDGPSGHGMLLNTFGNASPDISGIDLYEFPDIMYPPGPERTAHQPVLAQTAFDTYDFPTSPQAPQSMLFSPIGAQNMFPEEMPTSQLPSVMYPPSYSGYDMGRSTRQPQIQVNTSFGPSLMSAREDLLSPYTPDLTRRPSNATPSSSNSALPTPDMSPFSYRGNGSPLINRSPRVSPGNTPYNYPLDHPAHFEYSVKDDRATTGFLTVQSIITANPQVPMRGQLVLQKTYRPHTQSDRKRYVEEVRLEAPIMFYVTNPETCGISLRDAINSRFMSLKDRDDPVLVDRGPSVSIRINWPGYVPWSKQIPTRDFRSPPQPITRAKLAKGVARVVQRFIDDMQTRNMEEDAEPAWRVGAHGITLDDLDLVGLQHVSMGSWQAHLCLRPRTHGAHSLQ